MEKECATVVTQVVVDEKDPGFQHPTKPVGSFYTKEEAEKIAEEKGFIFVEDAGRGYRRVVPSPIPKRIVELNVVDQLVRAGDIVITVGGGGIPVVETEDGLLSSTRTAPAPCSRRMCAPTVSSSSPLWTPCASITISPTRRSSPP